MSVRNGRYIEKKRWINNDYRWKERIGAVSSCAVTISIPLWMFETSWNSESKRNNFFFSKSSTGTRSTSIPVCLRHCVYLSYTQGIQVRQLWSTRSSAAWNNKKSDTYKENRRNTQEARTTYIRRKSKGASSWRPRLDDGIELACIPECCCAAGEIYWIEPKKKDTRWPSISASSNRKRTINSSSADTPPRDAWK